MTISAVNPRPQDFKWANDKAANLREPIQGLKDKGWQYADIPTASNFNWLFNEIGTWQHYLESRSDQTADDLLQLSERLENTKVELKILTRQLKSVFELLLAVRTKLLEHHPFPPLPVLIMNFGADID